MHKAMSTDGKKKRTDTPPAPAANDVGSGLVVFPASTAAEEGNQQASRRTPARSSAQAHLEASPQAPVDNPAPRNEEQGISLGLFEFDGGDAPQPPPPAEMQEEFSVRPQRPPEVPLFPPDGGSSSSSSSPSSSSESPGKTRPPEAVVGPPGNSDIRHLQQPSPRRNDSSNGSVLERLALALEKGGINRRMDDLQIKMLADYQPFDPARDDIKPWTAGFKRLVPDDASDEQVLKALECRLPHQYSDLLRQTRSENGVFTICWKESVRLFLDRVSGSENRLVGLRRLRMLTQNEDEPIRQFAIRVRDLLQRIRGKEPTDQEWKDEVMVGAHDATAMELDRLANQTPEVRDFWEVIRLAEFWERQQAALLIQIDPSSASDRSPSKGAAVLLPEPTMPTKEPTVVCTWCSQQGHLEITCFREPHCARCFGGHPERHHDAVVMARRADFAASILNLSADAEFSAPRGRNFSGARDSKDFDLSRPPPPPPRALERAAQDAAERARKESQRGGNRRKKGGYQKVLQMWPGRSHEETLSLLGREDV